MKSKIYHVAILLTIALATVTLSARSQQKPEDAAQDAASYGVALVDDGRYAESWDHASELFRNTISKEGWKSALHGTRDPLGKVISRKVISTSYTKTLPGAPDGEYVVTPMLEHDGAWRVSGYLIE